MLEPQKIPNIPRMLPSDQDEAWEGDTGRTNYKLQANDVVTLKVATKGDFSAGYFLVPQETVGVVVNPRTPRVVRKPGTKSAYFANVDVVVDGAKGRVRVPHSALRKVAKSPQL